MDAKTRRVLDEEGKLGQRGSEAVPSKGRLGLVRVGTALLGLILASACASDGGLGGQGGAGGAQADSEPTAVASPDSAEALAVVRVTQQRFRRAAEPVMLATGAALPTGRPPSSAESQPVLRPSDVERIEQEGGRLVPRLTPAALAGVQHQARVELPLRASEPFGLTDKDSGVSLEVTLKDAGDSPAEMAEGYVVYRGATGQQANVVHRATAEGTEDFVVFEQAPAEPAVHYLLSLGEGVAGLRLVANTLELLDDGGTPRLRVAPPYLIASDGTQHVATLAVDDCAIDTDSSPPFGRAVTAPTARQCGLNVSWSGDAVSFPALLDPSWTTTGSLATARDSHRASVLTDGLVLVAGGEGAGAAPLASAEIYDPATGVWTATGSMSTARYFPTASLLADGRVIVAGGWTGIAPAASAEIYTPGTGLWSGTGGMSTARYDHSATVLADGRVLVAGGFNGVTLASAEVYTPATGLWSVTGTMTSIRYVHTANLLPDGRVLVAAGGNGSTRFSSAEIYTPGTGVDPILRTSGGVA